MRMGGSALVLVLVSACSTNTTPTTGRSTTSAPSATVKPSVTASQSATARPLPSSSSLPKGLRAVSWDEAAVPGAACFTRGNVRLHHGQALIPNAEGHPVVPGSNGRRFDQLELLTVGDTDTPDVTYGALQGPGSVDAAVRLWCNNNGGTADGSRLVSIAIYSIQGVRLHLLGLITPRVQPRGELPTLLGHPRLSPGHVTVPEKWYRAVDSTCCPSGASTSRWKYSNRQLVPESPTRN